ncbi:hypothetical protein GCM10028796_57830 [Ramlibacter monticola]|uniref:Peptidase S24/S26A/S26B/S26C domain-containing protein n=1 Tax=Ramlibacter monticola TaxID=1926872 RepID=A0A937CTP5_9BURK|nr:hypothetical protein [Ramlibacter monticola]MBL0391833.1 hypothetical protein [Ramlibacter monticola]
MAIHDPEVVAAIGQLLRGDPQRTLVVADSLRGPDRYIESTVSGFSMGPDLPPGSRIRIALLPPSGHAAGQIVAYLANDQVIVHRVLHCGRAGPARKHLIARGDATLVPDPPVELTHVLGPVTGVWSAGGWKPPADPRPRSARARLVRALLAALAIAGMYLSPRATARALIAVHRGAGALRGAWGAALQQRRDRGRHEPS